MCLAIPARDQVHQREPHGRGRHHGRDAPREPRPRPRGQDRATTCSCTPVSPSRWSTRRPPRRRCDSSRSSTSSKPRRDAAVKLTSAFGDPLVAKHLVDKIARDRDDAGQVHGGVRHAHRRHRPQRPARGHAGDHHPAVRPRLPGVRDREPRHRHRPSRSARQPGVIVTTFGDMMKVPGLALSSLQKEKADGRDIRVVYSPLDALQTAEDNPDNHVVFLGVGFETTAPTIASAIQEAARRGLENFSVLSVHKTVPEALRALVNDPEVQINGFILPGHVSAIIGLEPYRFLAEEYGVPVRHRRLRAGRRAAGRLDARQAGRRGPRRGRDRLQARRHAAGQPDGARRRSSRSSSRSTPSGAASASSPAPASASASAYAEYDALKRVARHAAEPPREIPGCQCGEVLRGVTLPFECRLFGKGCTPEHPDRPVHGLLRGLVRGVLPLHRLRPRRVAPGGMRADHILLAHGCGGTMMRELIEDVFIDRFADPALLRMDDAASLDVPTGRIAMSTDTYVVQPVFFPGGDIGRLAVCGTVNDIATSGATPLYLTVGFVLEEGFPVADLRRDPRLDGRRGRGGGRAHRHRRHEGRRARSRRRRLHQHRRRRRARRRRRPLGLVLQARATRCCSPARSATTASRSSPSARASRSGPTSSSDAAPLNKLVAAVLAAAPARPLLPRPHARRPVLDAQRARLRLRRLDHRRRDRRARARPGARRVRDARLRRLPGRQRGQDGRRRPAPSRPTRRSRR